MSSVALHYMQQKTGAISSDSTSDRVLILAQWRVTILCADLHAISSYQYRRGLEPCLPERAGGVSCGCQWANKRGGARVRPFRFHGVTRVNK